jgi:hypothetical protein|tara:strand:- start:340 stop:582 length:243 start_codon:yes stop_codon:yes gene_type:complete
MRLASSAFRHLEFHVHQRADVGANSVRPNQGDSRSQSFLQKLRREFVAHEEMPARRIVGGMPGEAKVLSLSFKPFKRAAT